jgi:hypothetical protein
MEKIRIVKGAKYLSEGDCIIFRMSIAFSDHPGDELEPFREGLWEDDSGDVLEELWPRES